MYTGKLLFSQLMDFMPLHTFRRCVARYQGDHKVKKFPCIDQYLSQASAFFLIHAKSNLQCRRIYSYPVDRSTSLIYDPTIMLNGFYQSKDYPEKLRRVKYHNAETDLTIVLMPNNFNLPALAITEFYRSRWQEGLFFKWIKQHLRIKSFYGTLENAVKTQIWIAISVYVMVAILKKQLRLPYSLYTILQVLSVSVFERIPLCQLFTMANHKTGNPMIANQVKLFDQIPGR